MLKKIVIIGNGVSGVAAARHIRKNSDHHICIISSETKHFYSRTALMYIYMGHMKYENTKPYEDHFWNKNKIDLLFDHVSGLEATSKQLHLTSGRTMDFDILIIATGSKSNMFDWPGQELKGVQGLYSMQDLDTMEIFTKGIDQAVVAGGGLIGIEMAEMLMSRNINVTFLVRESSFWNKILPAEESAMINRHIQEHHIDLRLSTEIKEIHGDNTGRVKRLTTSTGDIIDCQFVGITVGVHPNISFLSDSGITIDRGVIVNEYLQTNIPEIYAIGDCAQHASPPVDRRPVEQVWYTGKIMGETVAKTICGEKAKYSPGLWFNSAKFFDIEYQTYGVVQAKHKEAEEAFYWEHKSGKKSLRIVFDKKSRAVTGVNVFGIRLRHALINKWILKKETVEFVLENLYKANFDPEFFPKYENEIIDDFTTKYPNSMVSKQKTSFLKSIFS